MRLVDLGDDSEDQSLSTSTFAHLAKCGGTLMKHALRASVKNLRLSNENSRMYGDTVEEGEFTIGTVRNPYDYYVSDWAFASDPKRYWSSLKRITRDLGEEGARSVLGIDIQNGRDAFGDSAEDRARFRRFVQQSMHNTSSGGIGLMSLRFYAKYLDGGRLWPKPHKQQHAMIPSSHWNVKSILKKKASRDLIESALKNFSLQTSQISCWVKNERLSQDLKRCLRVYEDHAAARGIDSSRLVNWERLDSKLAEYERHSKHAPCTKFYDKDLVDEVARTDAHIIRAFTYRKHCSEASRGSSISEDESAAESASEEAGSDVGISAD